MQPLALKQQLGLFWERRTLAELFIPIGKCTGAGKHTNTPPRTVPYYLEVSGWLRVPRKLWSPACVLLRASCYQFCFHHEWSSGDMFSSQRPLLFMVSNPAHRNTGWRQLHQAIVLVLDGLAGNSLLFAVLTSFRNISARSPLHLSAHVHGSVINSSWSSGILSGGPPKMGKNTEITEDVYCKHI